VDALRPVDKVTGAFLKWGTSYDPIGRYPNGVYTDERTGAKIPIKMTVMDVLGGREAATHKEDFVARRWPGPKNYKEATRPINPTQDDIDQYADWLRLIGLL